MSPRSSKLDMSREIFLDLVDWMTRDPYLRNTVHLMGGEPTLHKDFVQMVQTVQKKNLEVKIFSNLATKNAPEYAKDLKDLPVRWIINVNLPETRSANQDKNLRESLQILKDKVTLTFNMVPELCSQDWLIDLICEYKLNKNIKVGFVLPNLSHTNEHLKEEDYPKVARRVVDFASVCEKFDISLEYECGIPWCSFNSEQLGELWHLNSEFFSSCNSILDITPDGHVIYCLPLATFRAVHFANFKNYPEAKRWFESILTPYRPLGSTPRCFSCNLLRLGVCRGGCMARILHGAKNIRMGETIEQ